MEKQDKIFIISLLAGIVLALIIFVAFSLGSIYGSHLRFYGYRHNLSESLHHKDKDIAPIIGIVKSVSGNNIKVLGVNKKIYTFNKSKIKVISFSGKPLSEKSLKDKIPVVLREFKNHYILRYL